jgi:hypothetical protein
MGGTCRTQGNCEMHATFLLEIMKRRDYSEDLGIVRTILKWILRKWSSRAWISFIWLRIGTMATSCDHYNRTFGFRKRRDISWPVEYISALSKMTGRWELGVSRWSEVFHLGLCMWRRSSSRIFPFKFQPIVLILCAVCFSSLFGPAVSTISRRTICVI